MPNATGLPHRVLARGALAPLWLEPMMPLARRSISRRVLAAVLAAVALLIVVDGAHARSPLDADPFVQSAMLTASDGIAAQYVGESVAVAADGTTIVVGGSNHGPGATFYVYEKPATGWADAIERGTVHVSTPGYVTNTAHAVAISANGDTIVVGDNAGPANVFTRPGDGWSDHDLTTPTAKLTPSAGTNMFFGDAVGISGETIVVGARGATVGARYTQGAVYVYAKPAGGWQNATETARLTASDGTADERLGASVAIDGDTIVANSGRGPSGTVYVFTKPGGGWVSGTQIARLTTTGGTNNWIGSGLKGLAIAGDTVVAGAAYADVDQVGAQGLVYVFVQPPSGWQDMVTETAQLTASDPRQFSYLGRSVAYDGSTIVAGGRTTSADFRQGAAYVFAKPAGGWATATETQQLTASDGQEGGEFGYAVAVAPKTVVAGAPFASAVTPGDMVGKAYVFSAPSDPEPVVKPPEPIVPPVVPPVVEPPVTQLAAGALACTSAKVVLINVLQRAGKVVLSGATSVARTGETVKIKYLATGAIVASGKVGEGGLFSFTVPLPPAEARSTNAARYQAILGSNVSPALKLERRAEMLHAKLSKGRVELSGRVTGSFRAGAPVTITVRATCRSFKTVAKTKLSRTGTFRASVPAPTGAGGQIAVYRASTTVLRNRRPQGTFTLPMPPTP